jgi:DNA-binding GntR family transcriptional regulator
VKDGGLRRRGRDRQCARGHDFDQVGRARNPVLSRLLENVYAQILVLRLRSLYLPERVESSVAEHREIFEAVLAGDAERGERLARAHAEHVLQDALEFTRRRPGHASLPS